MVMIVSQDQNINSGPSWFKTEISSISTLEEFPFFTLLKIFNFMLTNGFFLFLILTKLYASYYRPASSEEFKIINEIQTYNPQNAILIGTTISLVFSLLIISSIIKTYFYAKLSYLKIPVFIRKDRDLSSFFGAIKSPEIVPKGFDVVISSAWGIFGILFFVFLLIVNQENNTILDWLSFLITYNTIFYCLMMSVFIALNPYSLLNSLLLFLIILLPPYLANKKIFPESYESLLIFWLPIITLYILPLIAKSIRKRKTGFIQS